jgi:hypothetical protein
MYKNGHSNYVWENRWLEIVTYFDTSIHTVLYWYKNSKHWDFRYHYHHNYKQITWICMPNSLLLLNQREQCSRQTYHISTLWINKYWINYTRFWWCFTAHSITWLLDLVYHHILERKTRCLGNWTYSCPMWNSGTYWVQSENIPSHCPSKEKQ